MENSAISWLLITQVEEFLVFCLSFFFINLFIYLFLAALGLCCCYYCIGLLFVAVRRLLTVVASLAVEHGL